MSEVQKYVAGSKLGASTLIGCVRCGTLVFDYTAHETAFHEPKEYDGL